MGEVFVRRVEKARETAREVFTGARQDLSVAPQIDATNTFLIELARGFLVKSDFDDPLEVF